MSFCSAEATYREMLDEEDDPASLPVAQLGILDRLDLVGYVSFD